MSMDVSVIIVNYNTKELTRNCLKSVFEKTKGVNFEVIVSDNGSTDGSIEMIKSEFPEVILIENNANLGFGAANNRALKIARGKYVFYLNSDTLLLNNAVKIFFDYWETSEDKEKLGALGCWLQDENGNTIHSGGCFPEYRKMVKTQAHYVFLHFVKGLLKVLHLLRLVYPKYKPLVETSADAGKVTDVEYVTGADLFMRNNTDARYDERFFLYFEESDMQFQMAKKGLIRRLIPDVKVCHLEKKRRPDLPIITFSGLHGEVSSVLYAKKNLNTKARLLSFLLWLDFKNYYVNKLANKFGLEIPKSKKKTEVVRGGDL